MKRAHRRRGRAVCAVVVICFALVMAACGTPDSLPESASGAPGAEARSPFRFTDVTPESGIEWRCAVGTDETDYILETTGPGLAWFDYDNDGDTDLFLVNGSHFAADTLAKYDPRCALYRNDGEGVFVDITDVAGVGLTGWGGAALAADFDGDGWTDLYVTAWGSNTLFRNRGDGTFEDVTARAGVGDTGYSAAASALDYDRDGLLDIYVANYVPFDTASAEKPGTSRITIVRGLPMSAAPEGYDGEDDVLYRNNGDGTFSDVSVAAGIHAQTGRGLGTITLDFDDDGWTDLYVANDAMRNFLLRNNGDGTFTDVATRLGAAFGEGGVPMGSMGVAAGDLDGDGWPDILVANYADQTPNVFHNERGRYFRGVDVACGIGGPSLIALQWGVVASDFDLDADLDVYIAAGHVTSRLEPHYPHLAFAQRNLLYENDGAGHFDEIGLASGEALAALYGSRGAAGADFDNDGDTDIAVVNKSGPFRLLRNDGSNRGNWLRLMLTSRESAPHGIGAKVVVVAGGKRQVLEVRAGSSYASTEDVRPLVGLGSATIVDSVIVRWSLGGIDVATDIPANSAVRITEGEGHESLP